jgi:hypothetical protein
VSGTPVRLQLLMRAVHRNARDIEAAVKIAERLGLVPSGRGVVTFSVRASSAEFERLFGSEAAPQVPEELRELVESASVAPQHESF